ncbi:hypothetical protein Hypma_012351 [Hypsizygus marmoreus]|uniref:Uncharacterized protein n=1 Tax=Hypsizygus marmoreus TaxID=39966 RepID=A0A369K8D4_HYPMA|nr:hypothetical protein Hypma_012351 [Hypsizygus marmoreus]
MRVCLDATYGFAGTTVMMTTLAPSEPLLSEAAARLAYEERETINAAQLLKYVLYGFPGIDRGARDEFFCMLLLNNARDMAVYGERTMVTVDIKLCVLRSLFFEALFRTDLSEDFPSRAHPRHAGTPFKMIFADAKMNFNHFVTVHEEAAIEAKYLFGFTARSATVFCKDAHMDVDGVNTFVYHDETVRRSNIGVILWRCTSDPKHMDRPDLDVFARMDPFELGVLPSSSPGPDDAPYAVRRA